MKREQYEAQMRQQHILYERKLAARRAFAEEDFVPPSTDYTRSTEPHEMRADTDTPQRIRRVFF